MYFQVHVRHESCISNTVTCNCAVAVREGNDILGIHSCNGPITPIRYLRDPQTPDGKADIKRRTDGSYKVRLFAFLVYRPVAKDGLEGLNYEDPYIPKGPPMLF